MVIGELHKVRLSGDSYELIVENENDVPLFCALSIAITIVFIMKVIGNTN